MKKNLIIIILAIATIFSVLYAFIKADEAAKEQALLEVTRTEALAEKDRGEKMAELARQRAEEAIIAQGEAERLREKLMECQSK